MRVNVTKSMETTILQDIEAKRRTVRPVNTSNGAVMIDHLVTLDSASATSGSRPGLPTIDYTTTPSKEVIPHGLRRPSVADTPALARCPEAVNKPENLYASIGAGTRNMVHPRADCGGKDSTSAVRTSNGRGFPADAPCFM